MDPSSRSTLSRVPVVPSFVTRDTHVCPSPATGVSIDSPTGESTSPDSSAMRSDSQQHTGNLFDVSGTVGREMDVPPITSSPASLEPVPVPAVPTTNTHAMVTQSKAGVFKPKVLCVDSVELLRVVSLEEAR
ncbi:hypothetical protein GOBAR_AA08815 [Gossypium barbadense]|uniref:Uncharacterized protein n=1 Tax=Gossypium barbadense TaxID=3634 RepID=A0A2P5Y8C2_GOSBA|nr:hypothetical protein GOBAR_AA08815 [Gossypium barbadense]